MPAQKSALVHIGFPKTGTTSIQTVVRALERGGRLPDGIAMPSLGRYEQMFLPVAYQTTARIPRAMRGPAGREPERLRRELREAWIDALRASPSIVVSSEFLSLFSAEETAAFHRDLLECGYGPIRCLVYVRDPAGLYLSSVQQNLKASSSFVHPAQFRAGYKERIACWSQLADVHTRVRLFQPDALLDGDVVTDFLDQFAEFFGVHRPESLHERRNESMSAEGMILLQKYRHYIHPGADDVFMPDSNRLSVLISEIEPKLTRPLTPPRLRDDVARLVHRRTADDIDYLSTEFGLTIDTGGDAPEAKADSFSEVSSILNSYDPAALAELYCRILSSLLRSAPP